MVCYNVLTLLEVSMRDEWSANQALASTVVQRRQAVIAKPSSPNGLVVWCLRVCAGCASAVVCIKVVQCFM